MMRHFIVIIPTKGYKSHHIPLSLPIFPCSVNYIIKSKIPPQRRLKNGLTNLKIVPIKEGRKLLQSLVTFPLDSGLLSVQQSVSKLVDLVLEVLTCHRTCQGRRKKTRGGSSLPRTAGTTARGGAETAWHTSTLDPLLLLLSLRALSGGTGALWPSEGWTAI